MTRLTAGKTALRTLLAALILAGNMAMAEPPKGVLTVSDTVMAPPLRLANSDGEVTDLAELRGRWVMVHFWASWCGPCRVEMPTVQAMSKQPVARRMELVLVNTAESEDTIFEFLPVVAPDLDTLRDADGKATELWAPRGLPSTYLIDPKGAIRFIALGGRDWNSPAFLSWLDQLLPPEPGR
jgi:thiol-disulfide isomerase/thioredoxin